MSVFVRVSQSGEKTLELQFNRSCWCSMLFFFKSKRKNGEGEGEREGENRRERGDTRFLSDFSLPPLPKGCSLAPRHTVVKVSVWEEQIVFPLAPSHGAAKVNV